VLTRGTERLQAEGGVLSNTPQRRNRNRYNICELGIRMSGGAMEQECLDETKLERWTAVVLICSRNWRKKVAYAVTVVMQAR
jgi:hypothetical protein